MVCDRIEIGLKCCVGIGWSWGSSIVVVRYICVVVLGKVIVVLGRFYVVVVEVCYVVVLINLMIVMRGVDIVFVVNVVFLSRYCVVVGIELMVDLRR